MAQLELFLEPVVGVHPQLGQIDGQWVAGVRGADGGVMWDHDGAHRLYQQGEQRLLRVILPSEMARRAVAFFAKTRMLSAEHAPAYNCHTLPFALADRLETGLLRTFDYQHLALETTTSLPANTLVPGRFYYAKRPGDDRPAHSFVALDGDTTVSVLGDNQPLVVMSPDVIATLYGADRFVRYTPIKTRLARSASLVS